MDSECEHKAGPCQGARTTVGEAVGDDCWEVCRPGSGRKRKFSSSSFYFLHESEDEGGDVRDWRRKVVK